MPSHVALPAIADGRGGELRRAVGLLVLRACRWPLLLAASILGTESAYAHVAREIAAGLLDVY